VSVVYDAGVLIAADRSDRTVWAEHRARLELGYLPVATAPVIAQVSRSGRQAQLRRFLRGCEVVPFGADDGHDVGALVERSGVADVVDVHVVLTAHHRGAAVVTSDPSDLAPVARVLSPSPPVFLVEG
jgi:predicted nucleic acid-binding protein